MKKVLVIIVVFVICAAGLMMFSNPTTPSDKEAGGDFMLSAANMPLPAEVLALEPGESMKVEVTPELREYYFGLARTQAWCYLPEFDEGEPPTNPLEYWLLVQLAGVTGWDENGYYIYSDESPWREVNENTPEGYGTYGMPVVSKAELDEWVQAHFANASIKHDFYDYHKGYDYDGENYYGVAEGSYPLAYFELTDLKAENPEGRLIYTATLYENSPVDEYNFFWPSDELTLAENRASLAEKAAAAEPAEKAIYDAYGEQLLSGEMSMDEAIRQMIINGQTQNFVHSTQLEVKYYLDEKTGVPVYLQVHWQSQSE